ncbi:hypothetical protein N7540_007648 [Penicillium herquei]|nr:hypothetical protein N7540_007648 [Penicillium herquei]
MQVEEFLLDQSSWPADLLEEVNRAHDQAAQNIASQDRLLAVFIVLHERKMVSEESEFIIEGVYSALEMANRKTMEIFQLTYPDYPSSSFMLRGFGEALVRTQWGGMCLEMAHWLWRLSMRVEMNVGSMPKDTLWSSDAPVEVNPIPRGRLTLACTD